MICDTVFVVMMTSAGMEMVKCVMAAVFVMSTAPCLHGEACIVVVQCAKNRSISVLMRMDRCKVVLTVGLINVYYYWCV